VFVLLLLLLRLLLLFHAACVHACAAGWQVYVQGELLGGCDIVLEMKTAGELKLNVEEMMHRMQATD
jgi:hypothetical protein